MNNASGAYRKVSDGFVGDEHKDLEEEEVALNASDRHELDSIQGDHFDADVKKKPTPLPKKKMFVLMCIVLSEGFASSMVLPFIAYMVLDFGFNEENVGFYAGYITASFFLTQLLSSFFWGWLSDVKGRRPVLLIGLFGNTLSALGFGFSKYFAMAITFRSLAGLLNGSTGVVKSYIRDITDETNQSKGYMMRSSGYSLGSVLGGFLGGVLARPAVQFPSVFSADGLFGTFPYLLPCIVSASINAIGLITGFFFLFDVPKEERFKVKVVEEVELLESQTEEPELADPPQQTSTALQKVKGFFGKYMDRDISLTIGLYTSVSFIWLGVDEVFGIWALRAPKEGGVAFSTFDIGITHAASSVIMLVMQQFIYVPLDRRVGSKNAYVLANLIWAPVIFLIPFTSISWISSRKPLLWTLLLIGMGLKSSMGTGAMAAINILINNAASSEAVGVVNGISTSASALAKLLAPVIGGSLFAATASSNLPFPLDYRCLYVLLSMLCIVNVVVAKWALRDSINYRKL